MLGQTVVTSTKKSSTLWQTPHANGSVTSDLVSQILILCCLCILVFVALYRLFQLTWFICKFLCFDFYIPETIWTKLMSSSYGLPNECLHSYLISRQQFISVNNSDSDPLQITCGEPQGSVLGPILFLIYINDFTNCSSIY